MNRTLSALALAAALATAQMATAAERATDKPAEPPTLQLSAEVRETVVPDLMRVVLSVERSGRDLGQANRQALGVANDALRTAKAAGNDIDASLQRVHTQPAYDEKGRPAGWKVRAEVLLTSKTFDKLGTLSGELSERMALDFVGFELSQAKRAQVQASLRKQLGQQFLEKARQMAEALGFSGTAVQTVALDEQRSERPVGPMFMAKASVASAPVVPTDAGTVDVSVSLQGQVVLQR